MSPTVAKLVERAVVAAIGAALSGGVATQVLPSRETGVQAQECIRILQHVADGCEKACR